MSFWDDLTGHTSANASNAAAADTYAKQQSAIAGVQGAGSNYATSMRDLAQGYAPYTRVGGAGTDALMSLLQNPGSVSSLPGYQFDQQQGIQALDRSAAARGMLNSGRQSKDLLRFGTGLADQTYGNQLQRLLGISQFGLGATGAQNQTIGQGLQGQLGAQQSAYGGAMNAAGTIGQGQVAGAQAEQQGAGNILGAGAYLGGAALGGGFGGGAGKLASSAGSGIYSLMSGKPSGPRVGPFG